MKVEFHSGVADKLDHVCRLMRKAQAAGARVAAVGDRAQLDRLDMALWSFDALSFIAHVRLRAGMQPAAHLVRSTLWLVDEPSRAPRCDVLVNLGPDVAPGWEAFARVIEVVAAEDSDAANGRRRWREYAGHAGVELVNHKQQVLT